MKAQRLQAQFVKKREIEQAKIQQTNGTQTNKPIFRGKSSRCLLSLHSCSEVLRSMGENNIQTRALVDTGILSGVGGESA